MGEQGRAALHPTPERQLSRLQPAGWAKSCAPRPGLWGGPPSCTSGATHRRPPPLCIPRMPRPRSACKALPPPSRAGRTTSPQGAHHRHPRAEAPAGGWAGGPTGESVIGTRDPCAPTTSPAKCKGRQAAARGDDVRRAPPPPRRLRPEAGGATWAQVPPRRSRGPGRGDAFAGNFGTAEEGCRVRGAHVVPCELASSEGGIPGSLPVTCGGGDTALQELSKSFDLP